MASNFALPQAEEISLSSVTWSSDGHDSPWELAVNTNTEDEMTITDGSYVLSNLITEKDHKEPTHLEVLLRRDSVDGFRVVKFAAESRVVEELHSDLNERFPNLIPNDSRRLAIFFNPIGGQKEGPDVSKNALEPILLKAGIAHTVFETTSGTFIDEWFQSDELLNYSDVISLSGDGGISQCMNGLHRYHGDERFRSIRFGTLPTGTGNSFASSADCWRVSLAISHIVRGRTFQADLLRVESDEQTYLAAAALTWGDLSNVVLFADEKLRMFKTSRYLVGMFWLFLFQKSDRQVHMKYTYREPSGDSLTEESEMELGNLLVCNTPVAQNRTSGRFSNLGRINDGKMVLMYNKFSSRWNSFKYLIGLRTSAHLLRDDHQELLIDEIEITPRSTNVFSVDGELVKSEKIRVTPLPGIVEMYGIPLSIDALKERDEKYFK